MDPNQFAQLLDQSGQVGMMVGEVRRRKALAKVLELAKVTDSNGNEVDLSDFVRPAGEEEPNIEDMIQAAEAEADNAESAQRATKPKQRRRRRVEERCRAAEEAAEADKK